VERFPIPSRGVAFTMSTVSPRCNRPGRRPSPSTLLYALVILIASLPPSIATAQNQVPSLFDLNLGWVQMRRARDSDLPLVTQGTPTSSLLNADEFAYGYQPGLDVSLTTHLADVISIDARYLGISEYDASIVRPFGSPVVFQTSPTSMFSLFGTGVAEFVATSSVQSTELNLRFGPANFGLSGGFRYARLAENVALTFDGTGNLYRQYFLTTNNLYGLQFGADGRLWEGQRRRFAIDGFAKIGVYINGARSHFFDLSAANPARDVFSDGSSSAAAMISELGLRPRLRLTDYIDLTFGYQLMWLTGVAQASQQMAAHGLLSTSAQGGAFAPPGGAIPTGILHSDTVFYHGSYVGMEIRW